MKTILILASLPRQLEYFREEAKKRLDVEINLSLWDEVVVKKDQPGKVFLKSEEKETDLSDFSLIFIRTVGKNQEKLHLLSDYVDGKVTIIDQDLPLHGRRDSKAFQYRKMADNGLPVIPYMYGSFDFLLSCSKDFSFPLIIKRAQGNQGKNVWLIGNKRQFRKAKRNLSADEKQGLYYLAQDYIENNGDYRLFVVGDRCLGVIKRVGQEKEFRNNVSLGGKATLANLPPEIVDLAISAAKVCCLDVAGVDIIFDKKGNPFVLEVNSAPQFDGFAKATGINVAAEIINFLVNKIKK